MTDLNQKLELIGMSLSFFIPELVLTSGILLVICLGFLKREKESLLTIVSVIIFTSSFLSIALNWPAYASPNRLFGGMVRSDDFSAYLKLLFDIAAIFSAVMTWRRILNQSHLSEYYALMMAIVLGAHILVMSTNLIMVFISLELISISSYVLAGFSFSRSGAEGSLKYFFFGSVASAIMLYGFTLLYGFTGTLDFSSVEFVQQLPGKNSIAFFIAALMAITGFLYKIGAAPMHPWSPDVYEAAPIPVIAFLSVVPKLAGVGILTKFVIAVNSFGQSTVDWQFLLCLISILSLTIGNFAALWQKNPKRLMAYSSIAQSGFLLVGIASFQQQGIHFMLFYASIYLLMNFLVFSYLQYFESVGLTTLASFSGAGKNFTWASVLVLVGFIALTGLPPTAGFTAKLFVFTSLWEAYQVTGKTILLWLLIFGLINTVVSLFYYLRIPYYAFIKSGESSEKANKLTFENFFGLILVLCLLLLFFNPGLLMGWINKINFVL